MENLKIAWNELNLDLEWDKNLRPVDQEWGNKGLGMIVFGLCSMGVLLPTIPTVISMVQGTAKGNPIGAIIAVFVILGWPIYWGWKQFFIKRHYQLKDKQIEMVYTAPFKKKHFQIPLREYKHIGYGRTASRSSAGVNIGQTPQYYVSLYHPDAIKTIYLYKQVVEPMPEKRMKAYAALLDLPMVNQTPEEDRKRAAFDRKMAQMLADRKQH